MVGVLGLAASWAMHLKHLSKLVSELSRRSPTDFNSLQQLPTSSKFNFEGLFKIILIVFQFSSLKSSPRYMIFGSALKLLFLQMA